MSILTLSLLCNNLLRLRYAPSCSNSLRVPGIIRPSYSAPPSAVNTTASHFMRPQLSPNTHSYAPRTCPITTCTHHNLPICRASPANSFPLQKTAILVTIYLAITITCTATFFIAGYWIGGPLGGLFLQLMWSILSSPLVEPHRIPETSRRLGAVFSFIFFLWAGC